MCETMHNCRYQCDKLKIFSIIAGKRDMKSDYTEMKAESTSLAN